MYYCPWKFDQIQWIKKKNLVHIRFSKDLESVGYIGMCTRRLITGIDPYGYGGQEVLQSAVCKMQVLESSWCDSTQIWKSENYGILQFHSQSMRKTWQGDEGKQRDGCSKSQSLKAGAPMFLGRRRWTSQPKKIENFLFFCLSFLFVSSCTKC